MFNSIAAPFSAIFFGVVLGIAAGLPIQASMNEYAGRKCQAFKSTHQLVSTRGFWGETKHCIDRRYL